MSRRKPLAVRKPSGQIRMQPQLPPPAEVRRLRDAALAGMRPAEWATMLGRLYLSDKITTVQFSVGKRWADLSADYSEACQSPLMPRSAKFDADGGSILDPDSAKGRREARRHARMMEDYTDGLRTLERSGKAALHAVRNVCVMDLAPAGIGEVEALRSGLQALAAFWSKPK
ncbi:hypothetical protein [Bradyrhizobium elkanii]|uniref:hypothetical protein n=1 Tax=Bradyrhizobium elkanii TaxID=29448 RepID=UPI0004BCF2B0|nr:hypothetical protein [Bradyrhizobium elkanii]WLA79595.1 hypothetical protein QNJ99_29890 [Bradyrhizobium elkanii]